MKTSSSYFISYCYTNKGKFGFSNTYIESAEELDSPKIVKEFENRIKRIEHLDSVVILNWKELKKWIN